jgi:heterodisulfide reductase subunit B
LLTKDVPMATRMVREGKLHILPSLARYPKANKERAKRVPSPDTIAYYPGCSLHGTSKDYNMSVERSMERLGIKLEEPEGWVCCGTTPAHSTDHVLSTVLPLRNVSLVKRAGHSYVTAPCPLCFVRLRTAVRDIQDPELRRQVVSRAPDLAAPRATDGDGDVPGGPQAPDSDAPNVPAQDVAVDHLLTTVTEHIGYERVAQAVVRPLEGLKVACYYGCVITRPPQLTGVEDYEYPTNMDRLVETLGAESLDWSYKTECCGASLSITKLPIALKMTEKILRDAKAVGADAVVVACPFCHVNLDSRQKQIEEESGERLDLPVLFFTQAMGLAFGIAAKELGLEKHFVDPSQVLEKAGLMT